MTRRTYPGAAVETTITGSVASSGAVTIGIADSTGWPDGSAGPFAIVVDPGTASEEKMLVTARSGLNLTVTSGNRGYDSTTAKAHSTSAVCYVTYTAIDFDEANAHINGSSAHAATAITFSPTGSISAATVQAALAEVDSEKAATSHTHTASDTSDFAEVVRDTIGTALTEGSGIDITVDDGADTITIAATVNNDLIGCEMTGSTGSSAGSATVDWTSEAEDDGFHSGSSDTITIPAGGAGIYAISVGGSASPTAQFYFSLTHTVPSVSTRNWYTPQSTNANNSLSVMRRMAVGDTVKVTVAGQTVSTNVTAWISMYRVGT